jgi:hypothetical protein
MALIDRIASAYNRLCDSIERRAARERQRAANIRAAPARVLDRVEKRVEGAIEREIKELEVELAAAVTSVPVNEANVREIRESIARLQAVREGT